MRTALLILFSGFVAAAALAQPAALAQTTAAAPPVLPLAEAVRLALAGNRDLAVAAQEVQKAAQTVEAARTQRYPRLNVSLLEPVVFTNLDLRFGPLGALPLPHNFALATATAAQPISQLYDIGLGIKASELSRDLASQRLRSARQTVVNEVERAYYGCLRAESGLTPARAAVDLFGELERFVGALADERAALESDRLEARVRLAQQQHDVVVLEDALATCRERLNVALARAPGTPFGLQAVPATVPAEEDVAAAHARALEQRPDIRQARIAIELARTDARVKKAGRWPRVSALVSYVGNVNMPLLPGSIAAAVVQGSWEPFDWGRKAAEIGNTEIAIAQAETALRQLEAAVIVDINAKFRALREAHSLIAVTELGERAARERLRVTLDRKGEGAALTKDLLQAQLALADADHKYQAALLAYWEARADFEKTLAEDR